jgi:hypothetical protein
MPFSFLNATAYLGTVKVAGTTFSGRLFSSKKDAEFSAAQVALTKLNQGKIINSVEMSCNLTVPSHLGVCSECLLQKLLEKIEPPEKLIVTV